MVAVVCYLRWLCWLKMLHDYSNKLQLPLPEEEIKTKSVPFPIATAQTAAHLHCTMVTLEEDLCQMVLVKLAIPVQPLSVLVAEAIHLAHLIITACK